MKLYVSSVLVDDQQKAQDFYTQKLGFETKHDIPMGEYRWLTLTEPGNPNEMELALEPNAHPAVDPFRSAMMTDGIPWTSFRVDDVQKEYDRLIALGVEFTQPPTEMGPTISAVLNDTCGNLIQIIQYEDSLV
ncbi:MAG: VOC family protein [Planctomycetaceae bacterium]